MPLGVPIEAKSTVAKRLPGGHASKPLHVIESVASKHTVVPLTIVGFGHGVGAGAGCGVGGVGGGGGASGVSGKGIVA